MLGERMGHFTEEEWPGETDSRSSSGPTCSWQCEPGHWGDEGTPELCWKSLLGLVRSSPHLLSPPPSLPGLFSRWRAWLQWPGSSWEDPNLLSGGTHLYFVELLLDVFGTNRVGIYLDVWGFPELPYPAHHRSLWKWKSAHVLEVKDLILAIHSVSMKHLV